MYMLYTKYTLPSADLLKREGSCLIIRLVVAHRSGTVDGFNRKWNGCHEMKKAGEEKMKDDGSIVEIVRYCDFVFVS